MRPGSGSEVAVFAQPAEWPPLRSGRRWGDGPGRDRVRVAGPDRGDEVELSRAGHGVPLSLPALSQDVSGVWLMSKLRRDRGVVTGGKSGLQAGGGKGFAKDFCRDAFVCW